MQGVVLRSMRYFHEIELVLVKKDRASLSCFIFFAIFNGICVVLFLVMRSNLNLEIFIMYANWLSL
jgi:hypothetical protein